MNTLRRYGSRPTIDDPVVRWAVATSWLLLIGLMYAASYSWIAVAALFGWMLWPPIWTVMYLGDIRDEYRHRVWMRDHAK